MVIRTEYRGQRYSMGSSDPLPAGFEIQFGSLNFQATGNGYLMRITNSDDLRAWRQAGADPASVAPAARAPATAQVDAAGPSAPPTLWPALATGADGAPTRCACRLTTQRDHRRDSRRSDRGALGLGATLTHRSARRHDGVRRLRQHRRHAGFALAAMFRPSGTPALPPTTSHPTAPPASCRPPPHMGTRSGTSSACLTQ
jgi:hypothetical protein